MVLLCHLGDSKLGRNISPRSIDTMAPTDIHYRIQNTQLKTIFLQNII